jgi:hypothetical protein
MEAIIMARSNDAYSARQPRHHIAQECGFNASHRRPILQWLSGRINTLLN